MSCCPSSRRRSGPRERTHARSRHDDHRCGGSRSGHRVRRPSDQGLDKSRALRHSWKASFAPPPVAVHGPKVTLTSRHCQPRKERGDACDNRFRLSDGRVTQIRSSITVEKFEPLTYVSEGRWVSELRRDRAGDPPDRRSSRLVPVAGRGDARGQHGQRRVVRDSRFWHRSACWASWRGWVCRRIGQHASITLDYWFE